MWSKGNTIGQAWDDSIKAGLVIEKMRCTDRERAGFFDWHDKGKYTVTICRSPCGLIVTVIIITVFLS